jgi:threonine/homoserine/homoserine lactone efflux protein
MYLHAPNSCSTAARGSKRNAFATIAGIELGVASWGLAAVFALSFLPQFVPAQAGTGALLGQWLRRENVKKWLERTSGGLLIGFGVTVAIES